MHVAGQCNNEEASVINCELLPPCEIYNEIRRILRQRFDIFLMVVNGLCEVTNNYCHQMRKNNCIISFFDYLLKRKELTVCDHEIQVEPSTILLLLLYTSSLLIHKCYRATIIYKFQKRSHIICHI